MINIQNDEFGDLIICAFRYALGRKTYITSTIAELILKYKHLLDDNHCEVIIRGIWRAFETNNYGMEMDKEIWQKVLNKLEE
jgi:hypothetical protein